MTNRSPMTNVRDEFYEHIIFYELTVSNTLLKTDKKLMEAAQNYYINSKRLIWLYTLLTSYKTKRYLFSGGKYITRT